MKKVIWILCAMVMIGAVTASTIPLEDRWFYYKETLPKSGIKPVPPKYDFPQKIYGGYALGRWVQFSDDKITRVNNIHKGYGHRAPEDLKEQSASVNGFLCESWNHNNRCLYDVDELGRIRYVSQHKWLGTVLI